MAGETDPKDGGDGNSSEQLDARTAYQVAANLYMQENTVTWARFNTMVMVNGIVAAAASITSGGTYQLYFPIIFAFAGLILCFLWWNMMTRGFLYHDVWRDAAYSLERQFFSEHIQTLHYGDQLRPKQIDSKSTSVNIQIRNEAEPRKHKIPTYGRARIYARGVIILFGVIYGLTIINFAVLAIDD
jgi:hypothetical protein